MKNYRHTVLLTALAAAASLTACSRDKAATKTRTEIENVETARNGISVRLPGAEDAVTSFSLKASACGRLRELRSVPDRTVPRFSLLTGVSGKFDEKGTSLSGAMDVATNAFLQLYFGEKFVLDTLPAFMEKAEESHRKGELSGFKLTALKAICKISKSSCRSKQFKATKEKIAEKFPGVTGSAGGLQGSIPLLLAQKIAKDPTKPFAGMDLQGANEALATETPLFASPDWELARDDVLKSLDAAVTGLDSPDQKERLCALNLWHRGLAQLLVLKGYTSVDYAKSKSKAVTGKLGALSTGNQGFAKKDYPGAMIEVNQERNPILSSETLADYSPEKDLYLPAERIPFGREVARTGGLSAQLAMLEMTAAFYEATSPAGPWVGGPAHYRLGDLAGEKTPHILPDSINPLACGLLAMNLKNIAARAIHKINGQGSMLKDGEAAKGIMLADRSDWTVRASDVATLVRVVANLKTTLLQFKTQPPAEWQKFHAYYEPAKLAKLVGSQMFGEDELKRLLPEPADRDSVLIDSLKKLELPLSILTVALTPDGTRDGQCIGEMRWDPDTGAKQTLRGCDETERKALMDSREILSRLTRSTIILPK